MALVPVYFRIDDEPSKALVMDDKVDFYLKLGAKKTPLEAKQQIKKKKTDWVKELVEAPVKDEPVNIEKLITKDPIDQSEGDKGSGEPNSIRFHELKLKELKRFEDIQDYAFQVSGKMIRKTPKGRAGQYRKNALRLIKGWLENGDQSG